MGRDRRGVRPLRRPGQQAGVFYVGDIGAATLKVWDDHISVDLTGVFLGCQTAVRQTRAQGGAGSIINIASAAAFSAHRGVRLLTQSLLDVAADSIRINSVYRALMRTGMTLSFDDALLEQLCETVPMRWTREADDVAYMNVFPGSDESRYVTGAEFSVHGGQTAKCVGRDS